MFEQTDIVASWLGVGSINMFGRPFSGKDTQGRKLADLLKGELVAGGDILRSHDDPKKIDEVIASGGIIPSDFYLKLVVPYLSQQNFENKPLILSAVGRSHGEEPIIMKATTEADHPMKAVISLQISEDEVWRRFELAPLAKDRGDRTDDNREALKTRLKKFQTRTVPVIEYYREKGLLIEVDGTLPREQVTQEIFESLIRQFSIG